MIEVCDSYELRWIKVVMRMSWGRAALFGFPAFTSVKTDVKKGFPVGEVMKLVAGFKR